MAPPEILPPEILSIDGCAIQRAAVLIRAGQCVAVPTETVYGLAADATSGEAVARIYAAKGRPSFNPLIVHVASLEQAAALAHLSPAALSLADVLWPGPLTMVLPARAGSPIAALATAGLATIAIRMPAHAAMRALIAARRPSARRALGQCERPDQRDDRRACRSIAWRPRTADPRWRRDAARARIDDRRRRCRSAATIATGAYRCRDTLFDRGAAAIDRSRGRDRGTGTDGEPLCARQAAAPRCERRRSRASG